MKFSSGINLIYGDNGCGKTSVLEAIHLMACGCSFRRSRVRDLVRWQQSRYIIQGNWHRYGVMDVQVNGDRTATMIALQGRQIHARQDLQEHLALVVDSPQSDRLIDGGPRIRRRWLDRLLLTLSPSIARYCHQYNRAMLQRSRLLRCGAGLSEIRPWNAQMMAAGRAWIRARNSLIIKINQYLDKEDWVDAVFHLSLSNSASECDDYWQKKLETVSRSLRVGPHCDGVSLLRNGREISLHGSHGQQKVMAITLRLMESVLRASERHLYPVLLLDDCFEALDHRWQQRVVQRLYQYPGQVVLTAPDATVLDDEGRHGANRLIQLSSLENFADESATVMLNGTGY